MWWNSGLVKPQVWSGPTCLGPHVLVFDFSFTILGAFCPFGSPCTTTRCWQNEGMCKAVPTVAFTDASFSCPLWNAFLCLVRGFAVFSPVLAEVESMNFCGLTGCQVEVVYPCGQFCVLPAFVSPFFSSGELTANPLSSTVDDLGMKISGLHATFTYSAPGWANVPIHMPGHHCQFTGRTASNADAVVSVATPEAGTRCSKPRVWQSVSVPFLQQLLGFPFSLLPPRFHNPVVWFL